jgi:type IV pilus assembly protein PilO
MSLDLKNIDPNNPGDWPPPIKAVVILILCALVAGAGYYFDTQHQLLELQKAEQQELSLKSDFEQKAKKAANYEAYKQQVEEMKQSLGAMLRQLPNKTEVANLLVDVSQTGLAAGLEFELFRPTGEARKEFYAELPIELKVNGSYHAFGEFVSGVAALPRIVTLHNINITSSSPKAGEKPVLTLAATARTYRYLDEDEQAPPPAAAAPAKPKAKGGKK